MLSKAGFINHIGVYKFGQDQAAERKSCFSYTWEECQSNQQQGVQTI